MGPHIFGRGPSGLTVGFLNGRLMSLPPVTSMRAPAPESTESSGENLDLFLETNDQSHVNCCCRCCCCCWLLLVVAVCCCVLLFGMCICMCCCICCIITTALVLLVLVLVVVLLLLRLLLLVLVLLFVLVLLVVVAGGIESVMGFITIVYPPEIWPFMGHLQKHWSQKMCVGLCKATSKTNHKSNMSR